MIVHQILVSCGVPVFTLVSDNYQCCGYLRMRRMDALNVQGKE